MNLKEFLKDRIITIFLIIFSLITIEIFLIVYPFANFLKLYVPCIVLFFYFIGLAIEYFSKKSYYDNFLSILQQLDDKYLVCDIVKDANFVEGKILKESLQDINKSMIENVNKYKYMLEDYKDYIELWIHDVKIPIAASKMVIENNKNDVTRSIDEELNKIDNYTKQALFYARSSTVEKDYYIKRVSLRDIVRESIRENKSLLIHEKVLLNLHDIDIEINTDNKWMLFIINQIIQNSLKYKKQNEKLAIEIYAVENLQNVILNIKDNGIGIDSGELKRVFDKGFTGTNGRLINKKSTGIGLYLCKKLCDKLGNNITISSKKGEGTILSIVFPNGSYTKI